MDEIFERRPGETALTKEQVIDEVHHFLCTKVFGCDEGKFSKNYLTLVCGKWAYYGRMYQKNHDEFEYFVDMEIHKISHMKEFNSVIKEKIDKETTAEKKAFVLDEVSNITQLEMR